jgi:CBS domain-containing protein
VTTDVVSVSEDTSLGDIAALLEHKRIKRVPVLKEGRLVGICETLQYHSGAGVTNSRR